MAGRDDVTTFEELQSMTSAQRREHFDASIVLDLDDLTPAQRALLEEQNQRVLTREARLRGKAS
jgi:hypothetical protein